MGLRLVSLVLHTISLVRMVRRFLRVGLTSLVMRLRCRVRREPGSRCRVLDTGSRCLVRLVMVLILLLPRLLGCRLPGGSRLCRRRVARLVG